MNMLNYSCGAIKVNNGPNGRINISGFLWLDFGLLIL